MIAKQVKCLIEMMPATYAIKLNSHKEVISQRT